MSDDLRKILTGFTGINVIWTRMQGQTIGSNVDDYPIRMVDLPEAALFAFEFIPVPEHLKDEIDATIGYDGENTLKLYMGFRDDAFALNDDDLHGLLPQIWNFVITELYSNNLAYRLIGIRVTRRGRHGVDHTVYYQPMGRWEEIAHTLRRKLGDVAIAGALEAKVGGMIFHPAVRRRRLFN